MEYIEIVLIFGGMGLGFAALYELVLWFSPEERALREAKQSKNNESKKLIDLAAALKLKTRQKVS
ncbi:hypothetical protein [Lactococcus ileimucosae]|uniref:hypothetical protein n=1 Tax=Lactococcus ileimucosae TaxID=2941329 RepID=UPI002043E968|nr:hypothetical protein [Lactococcus ileimucosae]